MGARLSGSLQFDHCLEVEGLRKQISKRNGSKRITRIEERAKIAGERGWIAGDIDDALRSDFADERSRFRAKSGARRINYDEVRSGDALMGLEE